MFLNLAQVRPSLKGALISSSLSKCLRVPARLARMLRSDKAFKQAVVTRVLLAPLLVGTSLLMTGCDKPTTYEKIQKHKTLHIITRNAPAVYFQGRHGPMGFEYELAKLFSEQLGVELDLKVASTRSQILSALDNNYTHIASAFMVASEARSQNYLYSSPYMETTPIVVYRYGSKRPRTTGDLLGKKVGIVSDSYHSHEIEKLKKDYPELDWELLDVESIDLMKMVQDQSLDFAIINSVELDIQQAYYPRVKKAFAIGDTQQISWYFPKTTDKVLIDKVNAFFARIKEDGTLMHLKERYFGHLEQLNYVGARTFIRHANSRLAKYENSFKDAADKYDLDWKLMAAVGYQESHWRPKAMSPTGVRGLMMLTLPTAKEMGVKNRLDAEQSIVGGTRYFAKMKRRMPERIAEPDRTWLALAAYNVGYGHLEDARILTEKGGKDPDKWVDVKEFLPLLQKKKYYKQTRYGYARGNEPVIYVQNIRRYYDVLNWMTESQPEEPVVAQSTFRENLIDETPNTP